MTVSMTLGVHYWREALRSKLLLAVAGLAFGLMALSFLVGPLSLGTGDRIARDMGLFSMVVAAVAVMVAGGSHMIAHEIDSRSVAFIVTRPVSRGSYLVGRYIGLVLLGWGGVAITTALVLTALLARGQELDASLLQAATFAGLEVSVMAAVVVFFASVAGPIASMMYAFGAFVGGHAMQGILSSASLTGVAKLLLTSLSWALPDLSRFDMRAEAVHGMTVGGGELGWAAIYAIGYAGALLLLAWGAFSRRELE